MMASQLSTFGKIARDLARNPLGIIALFIVLIYGFAALLMGNTATDLTAGQQIIVVEINEYAYLVPFVESQEGKFLKTIIPSRKATRDYLGGKNEQDKT